MNHKYLFTVFFLALLLISSCQTDVSEPEEVPPIQVINLQVTPALTHWLPDLAACAENIMDFGVFTQVIPRNQLSLDEADLLLRLGEKKPFDPYIAVMGYEELVVIVGADVPIQSLSLESLQAIYTGSLDHWSALPELIEASIIYDQPILTLSYPAGHEVRSLFRMVFLDNNAITSIPQPFSSIDYLETLLKNNPHAIGYGLKSQVPLGSKTLTLYDQNEPFSAQPHVLAITHQEPQGKLRQVLLCLQALQ